jgi:hypothetical protein
MWDVVIRGVCPLFGVARGAKIQVARIFRKAGAPNRPYRCNKYNYKKSTKVLYTPIRAN